MTGPVLIAAALVQLALLVAIFIMVGIQPVPVVCVPGPAGQWANATIAETPH